MISLHGFMWPDDVGTKWQHSFRHVRSIEYAIARCANRRTAVQAGGNIGLWPHRLAKAFDRVITFEPDDVSRECLILNVPPKVEVRPEALGDSVTHRCGLERKSLGSHQVTDGDAIAVVAIDGLGLTDVDLLQLDIEGYEYHALVGAIQTLIRCRPVVQVELRGFTAKYGKTDDDVRALLATVGYRQTSEQPGNDFVFEVER